MGRQANHQIQNGIIIVNLGTSIRLLRVRQDLTLAALAEKADLSVSYLSLVEAGKREPSLEALREIAKALGVPTFALMALAMPLEDLRAIPGAANSKLLEALMLLLEEGGGFASCLSPQADSES